MFLLDLDAPPLWGPSAMVSKKVVCSLPTYNAMSKRKHAGTIVLPMLVFKKKKCTRHV